MANLKKTQAKISIQDEIGIYEKLKSILPMEIRGNWTYVLRTFVPNWSCVRCTEMVCLIIRMHEVKIVNLFPQQNNNQKKPIRIISSHCFFLSKCKYEEEEFLFSQHFDRKFNAITEWNETALTEFISSI